MRESKALRFACVFLMLVVIVLTVAVCTGA